MLLLCRHSLSLSMFGIKLLVISTPLLINILFLYIQFMKFNQLTGLELTWEILHTMWLTRFSSLCSMADFVALACVEVTDYTMERGEIEGCMFTAYLIKDFYTYLFVTRNF